MSPNNVKNTKFFGIAFFVLALYFIFYILYSAFSGRLILPQFFSLGVVTVRYYGLFMALAVGVGFYTALKRAEKFGLSPSQAENLVFWLVVGGFVGARLYHIFSSWQFYLKHPFDILKVYNGGLSIYGVVFGGLITIWIYRKLVTHYPSPVTLLNWLTPSLILGQLIGRFGNFFNYELYGYPTNLPWKMFVPSEFRPEKYLNNDYFHPLFFYEQIGLAIIFLIVIKAEKQKKSLLFFYYLLLYNILRMVLEFYRIDSVFLGNVRVNALVSLVLVLIAFTLIFRNARNPK